MAAVLAAKMLAQTGLKIPVLSAGIAASPDCSASTNAVTVMGEEGCDLLSHRSQRLTEDLLNQAKLVLTMTSGHQTAVVSFCPSASGKVFTLNGYAGCGQDIDDPFGGDCGVYRDCAKQIKDLLEHCMIKIKKAGL
jgi:protein-tyrosine-phosphatase